jgi:hypothetical protein
MAGHLSVQNTMFRLALLTEAIKELKNAKVTEPYKRIPLTQFTKYSTMRLPVAEYNMDEESGFVDCEVIAVSRQEDTLEFHLDKNGKINAIYLVM